MIDISRETLRTLSAACRRIPGRTGKGIALTTMWRWITKGLRGTRLESVMIGGQRYVSDEALNRFIARTNGKLPQETFVNQDDQSLIEAQLQQEGL